MNNNSGFTLLEIMIAVTITGIIFTVVFSFINVGMKTWNNSIAESEWNQNRRILKSNLQQDLHNAFYSQLSKEELFYGDYKKITWLVSDDQNIKKISYTVDYNKQYIIRSVKYPDNKWINKKNESEDIIFFQREALKKVSFSFYDPKNKYWRNSWSYKAMGYFPTLIKVDVTLKEKMPSIIVDIYIGDKY